MNLTALLDQIKSHPHYADAGMVLAHNGVVRGFSRDGRKVTGLSIKVDRQKLADIVAVKKKRPGIIEILAEIVPDGSLVVGDDVIAVINVESQAADAFNEQDQKVLETLAMHISSATKKLRGEFTVEMDPGKTVPATQ